MASLDGAIATIVAFGGMGALIDFWIGKAGQKRVRDWLETWWFRLSYVRKSNFGRHEAAIAAAVMGRLFGDKLTARRRWASVVALLAVFVAFGLLRWMTAPTMPGSALRDWDYGALALLSSAILCALSLSITVRLAKAISRKLPDGLLANTGAFLLLLTLQLGMMELWLQTQAGLALSQAFAFAMGSTAPRSYASYLTERLFFGLLYPLTSISMWYEGAVWNGLASIPALLNEVLTVSYRETFGGEAPRDAVQLCEDAGLALHLAVFWARLFISAAFLLSCLLRPVQDAILTLWARIVESDKPVFTLCFGGTAAIVKGLGEILKSL
jgi:hypothetical protein